MNIEYKHHGKICCTHANALRSKENKFRGQTLDANEPPYFLSRLTGLSFFCCLVIRGSTGGFLLLRYFSGIVSHPGVLRVSQYVSDQSSSLTHHRPYS